MIKKNFKHCYHSPWATWIGYLRMQISISRLVGQARIKLSHTSRPLYPSNIKTQPLKNCGWFIPNHLNYPNLGSFRLITEANRLAKDKLPGAYYFKTSFFAHGENFALPIMCRLDFATKFLNARICLIAHICLSVRKHSLKIVMEDSEVGNLGCSHL